MATVVLTEDKAINRAKHLRSSPASSPGGRPPISAPPHRRDRSSVSDVTLEAGPWDSKNVADVIEQVGEMNESPSSRVARQLTLADINEVSPMECEAETLLLQALEEKEGRPQAEEIILPHVPDEGLDAFEATPVEPLSASGEQSFQDAADQVRSSNTDTKVKLAGLAHAMRLLHANGSSTKNVVMQDEQRISSSSIEPVEQDIPKSDADTFYQNANELFRRSSSESNRKEEQKNSLPDDSNVANPVSTGGDVEHGVSGRPDNETPQRKPFQAQAD